MAKQALAVLLFVTFTTAALGGLSNRIANGKPVDTLARFPHHVTIEATFKNGTTRLSSRYCSGSIIDESWILTSISCVGDAHIIQLYFQRMYVESAQNSFSIITDSSSVYVYPTEYDDLALVMLPIKLQFSLFIKPIPLSIGSEQFINKLTVMPGFNSKSNKLVYGMFRLNEGQACSNAYGELYDPYLNLCTEGWSNNTQMPCEGNEGGGLVGGWPSNSKLIGIFSSPKNCVAGQPAVYTKISEYIQWIQDLTGITSSEYDVPA